jgi:hypothetical protein
VSVMKLFYCVFVIFMESFHLNFIMTALLYEEKLVENFVPERMSLLASAVLS